LDRPSALLHLAADLPLEEAWSSETRALPTAAALAVFRMKSTPTLDTTSLLDVFRSLHQHPPVSESLSDLDHHRTSIYSFIIYLLKLRI
jgi:proteasome lid subunit RPN8/RPN11